MRRRLDAVLLLDKPVGLGSNAALQAAKRLYRAEKAGHAGTLDPLASGLLPIMFGEATKFSQLVLDADKEYLARARLGVTTRTGDAEGEVLERRPVLVDAAAAERALPAFRGEIEQVPPMFSALKHQGRPLYVLARRGESVRRAPRKIRVHALDLLGMDGETLELRVRCSKGTYIRTLVEDIGSALGCGAHLVSLRRVAASGFRIEEAVTLDMVQNADEAGRDRLLLPLDRLLEVLPRLDLPDALADRFARGQAIALTQPSAGRFRVYREQGALLGVAEAGHDGLLHPRRLLAAQNAAQAAEKHQKNL
ncbi:MAG TPA: tRNA pseudouridine(55) synthase TruB [Burkholderiales bacterium]|jgi:tRNA pseudouridine55 synthase|nr:tRNA pseudouridine(55) synthase TruB [Burkholderiales bacterium]